MDFLNSLLSFFLQLLSTAILAVGSVLSSFGPPPATPIVIAPEVEERSPAILEQQPVAPQKSTAAPEEEPVVSSSGPLLDVNGLARSAVVNIFCYGNTKIRSASGSGVVLDSRGVVLTNAHIAQFFLLRDYPTRDAVRCYIRTGSPARSSYQASLFYLPPQWIEANAYQITSKEASGTGEYDYAFLIIDKAYPSGELPEIFPSISYTVQDPKAGDPMLLAAYPSAFLNGKEAVTNLMVSSTFTIVKKLYSFHPPGPVDLFSIGSTSISQGGSSGGAAVRASDGKVMGIIAVASDAKVVEDRDLRALSLSYINRSLGALGYGSINELLSGDLNAKAAQFENTIGSSERKALVDQLEK